ncbi:ACH96234.1 GrBNV gp62-like protein [Kallithea virus]|uniref:ACH96234.1 GrBNV gp62-like protein n=1 Tax=Kallithea virus TaxID=1654582 RepID=A0A0F7KMT0_9VIRU|nr:ACH96234.1 GrBNV gp62-like protein [Kallithea virus]AKH40393.1 putative gp62-like protein [Kallithea virus]AQN78616.1 ACH96234.1 GrBNV gp62-like protein [Kallithea virus]
MPRLETYFISSYIPKPQPRIMPNKPNDSYKLKTYKNGDTIESLSREFQRLYEQKYTHVANVPGRLDDILQVAYEYKLICLDGRMLKYVAEYCSESRCEILQET